MTTVRKWGVQLRHGEWMRRGDIPSDRIECARLFDSPQDAAAIAGSLGTVREVLVTQEAGGWELLGCVGANVRETPFADGYVIAVKHSPDGEWNYTVSAGASLPDESKAVVHRTKLAALAALLAYRERNPVGAYPDCPVEVHAIRRTEPREVRRAGRTLDEILASVPVEVSSDE